MPKALFFHTNLFTAGVISSYCSLVCARHFLCTKLCTRHMLPVTKKSCNKLRSYTGMQSSQLMFVLVYRFLGSRMYITHVMFLHLLLLTLTSLIFNALPNLYTLLKSLAVEPLRIEV